MLPLFVRRHQRTGPACRKGAPAAQQVLKDRHCRCALDVFPTARKLKCQHGVCQGGGRVLPVQGVPSVINERMLHSRKKGICV